MVRRALGHRRILIVVYGLLAAACTAAGVDVTTTLVQPTGTSESTVTGEPEEQESEPVPDGPTFRVGLIENITTDNWWAAQDTLASTYNQAYLGHTKPSLFTLSVPGFVYIPDLAATELPVDARRQGDSWVVDQPIVEDRIWSDGTPVTAHDLAFYFETVRKLDLGAGHAAAFPPSVTAVSAIDDHTVRIQFSEEPKLAAWHNGVGLAPFVPAHFWMEHVEEATDAADQVMVGITEQEARAAIVEATLDDENPDNDLSDLDVTEEMITRYIFETGASEGRAVLYEVASPAEPSAGPQTFARWSRGDRAVTVSNLRYYDRGTERILYEDGSFGMKGPNRTEGMYGGDGGGEVLARYEEGPYVGEIHWIEHTTKEAAYEALAAGSLDYVYDPVGIDDDLRTQLGANPDLDFAVSQTEGFRYMAFNMRKPPMSDPAFRRAVATVIDKEMIAEEVLGGAVFPGYTILHPDLTFWHNRAVARPGWEGERPMDTGARFEEAIRLLDEAGYTWGTPPQVRRDDAGELIEVVPGEGLTMPNGVQVPEIELLSPGMSQDPLRATFALWTRRWMRDLGVPVETRTTDFDTIVSTVFAPQTLESAVGWDIYVLGWRGADPTLPGTSLVTLFHSREDVVFGSGWNSVGYDNPDFDEAADRFEAAQTLDEAREWTLEMERIIAEDVPYIVLFRTPIVEAFSRDVGFPVDSVMAGHSGFPDGWPGAVMIGPES